MEKDKLLQDLAEEERKQSKVQYDYDTDDLEILRKHNELKERKKLPKYKQLHLKQQDELKKK